MNTDMKTCNLIPGTSNLALLPLVPLAECLHMFGERFGRAIPFDPADPPDFVELGNFRHWSKLNGEALLAYYFQRYEEAAIQAAMNEVGHVCIAA